MQPWVAPSFAAAARALVGTLRHGFGLRNNNVAYRELCQTGSLHLRHLLTVPQLKGWTATEIAKAANTSPSHLGIAEGLMGTKVYALGKHSIPLELPITDIEEAG